MDCLICNRIEDIKKGKNPNFVAAYKSGYMVKHDNQKRIGYTLFLSKIHARELHELSLKQQSDFLLDMAHAAESVYREYKPVKLNIELLGNKDPHLHWHIIPRYKGDRFPTYPIWYEKGYKDAIKELTDNG